MKAISDKEAIENGYIGIEDPEIYDGVMMWLDSKTGIKYAREGFEDLIEHYLENVHAPTNTRH